MSTRARGPASRELIPRYDGGRVARQRRSRGRHGRWRRLKMAQLPHSLSSITSLSKWLGVLGPGHYCPLFRPSNALLLIVDNKTINFTTTTSRRCKIIAWTRDAQVNVSFYNAWMCGCTFSIQILNWNLCVVNKRSFSLLSSLLVVITCDFKKVAQLATVIAMI